MVLGGDINIKMLDATTSQCELVRLLESNACINTIPAHTRIQNGSATLLDVFITNIDAEKVLSGVIAADVSDHLPIFFYNVSGFNNKII